MKNFKYFISFVLLLKVHSVQLHPDFSEELFDGLKSASITMFSDIDFNFIRENFHLHCFTRKDKELIISSVKEKTSDMIEFTNSFNPDFETKIIIHGWMTNAKNSSTWEIVNAYRKLQKYNIIAVDWNRIAFDLYSLSTRHSKGIGEHLAVFIHFLIEYHGADPKKFHIIGHSLGAHIAGFAGKHLFPRIKRITGLDPALPIFSTFSKDYRLDVADADFVDIIHTTGGTIAYFEQIGHADFYPNDGKITQPGCLTLLPIYRVICSHSRASKYFAESIGDLKSFYSRKCNSWKDFKKSNCDIKSCQMGEYADSSCLGKFYLKTNSRSPYSQKQFFSDNLRSIDYV